MATVNWSLQHFTDTAANFTANNPTLLAGQLGIETDGLTTTPKFKIGDGVTAWNTLPYFYGGSASAQDLNNVLTVGNTTSGQDIVLTDDDKLQIGSTAGRYIGYDTNIIQIGLGIVNTNSNDHIVLQDGGGIHVDTTFVELPHLTASRVIATDANNRLSALTGTGFLTLNAGVISYDSNTYLTTSAAALAYHPLNGNMSSTNFGVTNSATSYFNFREISTGFAGVYVNTAVPSTTNYTFGGDGSYAVVNAPTLSVIFRSGNTTWATGTSIVTNASGGQFTISEITSTNNAANANVPKFISYGNAIQWASGTVSIQRENHFTSPTYSGAAATTLTLAANVVSDFPIASTNVSITESAAFYNPTRVLTSSTTTAYGALFNAPSGATNNWAIGAVGAVSSTVGYGRGATPTSSRPFNASSTVAGEYSFFITNLSSGVSAQAALRLGNNNAEAIIGLASTNATLVNGLYARSLNFNQYEPGGFSFTQQGTATSGAWTTFLVNSGTYTGQTASTEISNFKVNGASKTWAAGNITTQRWNYFTANTAAFASASTITNSYGLYVEAATAGGNASITNNWALGTNGGIFLNGTANTVLGNAALATNASTGFLHVPSCAGTPTGTPTLYTGMIPICADSTNNKLYIYSGSAWVALN